MNAIIQAAETARSPAIIQLSMWTIENQGRHFIKYVVEAAHSASVPIAVHMSHCMHLDPSMDPDEIEQVLELPFDSISLDGMQLKNDYNIDECVRLVAKAHQQGISIEAEMGRIDAVETGLLEAFIKCILTDPSYAREFVDKTGVDFIAPAFGNLHGIYGEGGPEALWNLPL